VPLVTAGLFANFFQKQSKRPSATKAKGISVVAVVVLCERRFFHCSILMWLKIS